DPTFAEQLGDTAECALYQLPDAFPQRMKRSGAREREEMRDPEVQAVHLLNDGGELLARGRGVYAMPGELGRGAQARERIAEPVRHRRRHLPDRRQLFRLDELRVRLAQPFRHLAKGPGKLPDLIPGTGRDDVVQVARAHDGHRLPQLVERAGQAARDEPGGDQPGDQREHDDRPEDAPLRFHYPLDLDQRPLHAEFPGLAIDIAIHRDEGGLETLHQLLAGGDVRGFTVARIIQLEHAVGDGSDLELDLADTVREGDFVRGKAGGPAIEPEVHDLLGERKLLLRRWIACEVAPHYLRLVEHRVFDFRVG